MTCSTRWAGTTTACPPSYEKKDKLEQDILDRIAKALDIPVEAITELKLMRLIQANPALSKQLME